MLILGDFLKIIDIGYKIGDLLRHLRLLKYYFLYIGDEIGYLVRVA